MLMNEKINKQTHEKISWRYYSAASYLEKDLGRIARESK